MHTADSNVAKRGLFDEPYLFNLPAIIFDLNAQRSTRLATLLTSYPAQHWIIILLLYVSVMLCFLEESDGAALQFLGGVQLRGLFTILLGASSAIGSLLVDLNDPFRGNFSIKQTTDQLIPLLRTLDSALLASHDVEELLQDTRNSSEDAKEGKSERVGLVPNPIGEWLTEEHCENMFCLVDVDLEGVNVRNK